MTTDRHQALDALRGLAMVWMTVFHFCFDLANAGFIQQDFYNDPFWTWQRTCILSLFLLCAGASLTLADIKGQTWPQFWKRWMQIAVCAALVSAGSYWAFPRSYIYFGVLHAMAVMLLIVRLTIRWGNMLWVLGVLALATKFIASYLIDTGHIGDFLNERAWNWLGLVSRKPITQDYVPLIPWLALMWWGAAGMRWLSRRPALSAPVPLARLGRWSLGYYMLHQPVLIALLSAFVWLKA